MRHTGAKGLEEEEALIFTLRIKSTVITVLFIEFQYYTEINQKL